MRLRRNPRQGSKPCLRFHFFIKMKSRSNIFQRAGLWALLAALVLSGCSWPGAYIQHNLDVADRFNTYQVYPGCQYFTSGTLEDPRAVLALKSGYSLTSEGWQPVQMTSKELEQWVQALKKDSFAEYNTYSDGAQIIDDQGNIAGFYFSVWEFPLIRFTASKELILRKPAADYRLDNDRTEFLSGGSDFSGD